MKATTAFRLLTLLFVASTSGLFAAAPASLAGKVYHETGAIASIRRTWEYTIVFTTDTRFVYLKSASGSPLNSSAPNKVFLEAPKSDGTYTYRRTNDSTATVELTFDDSSPKTTLPLNFTTAIGGVSDPTKPFPDWVFTLTDATSASTAPVANISLRGRVAPGTPLIAGLVVPGPTPVDNNQFLPLPDTRLREVLIRVAGPSLAPFGVAAPWADPGFTLFRAGTGVALVNEVISSDWSTRPAGSINGNPLPPSPDSATEAALRKIFTFAGAFPFAANSTDAAAVVRLAPGAYTIVCDAVTGTAGGEALIEVYFLP